MPQPTRIILNYTVALVSVLAALLVRWLLASLLGESASLTPFIAAIAFAAWFGGLGPGLIATGLSAALGAYFFLFDSSPDAWMRPGPWLHLALFLFSASVVCFLSKARDVASSEYVASEERFRLLIEGVKDHAIFMLDPQGRIALWTDAAERLKGWKANEVLGKHFSLFYTPEDLERRRPQHQLEEAARQGFYEDEGWQVRRDGSRFWASVVVTALHDELGNLRGFSKVTRDITERRKVDEAMRQLNATLEQRVAERTAQLQEYQMRLRRLAGELVQTQQQERRRIATDVHDQLAQTLAIIKMKVGRLRTTDPALARTVGEVEGFLGQCIQYTRLLMTELNPPVLQDLGLTPALDWLGDKFLQQYGVKITVRDDGKFKPISADFRSLLFVTVHELLTNVVKHAKVNEATVELSREDHSLRLVVADMGVGFDLSQQPAFDAKAANGFGLFKARERLDLLGGKLSVESAPGQGTRVTMLVPLEVDSPEQQAVDVHHAASE